MLRFTQVWLVWFPKSFLWDSWAGSGQLRWCRELNLLLKPDSSCRLLRIYSVYLQFWHVLRLLNEVRLSYHHSPHREDCAVVGGQLVTVEEEWRDLQMHSNAEILGRTVSWHPYWEPIPRRILPTSARFHERENKIEKGRYFMITPTSATNFLLVR